MRERVEMQMQMENPREPVGIVARGAKGERLPVGMGHSIVRDKERFRGEQMP